MTGLAAVDNGVVRLLLVNKLPDAAVRAGLTSETYPAASAKARVLTASDPLGHSDQLEVTWTPVDASGGVVELPAHSLTRVDLQ